MGCFFNEGVLMNILKKIIIAAFCCAFFAARTKIAKEAHNQAYNMSLKQECAWDGRQKQRGDFIKR